MIGEKELIETNRELGGRRVSALDRARMILPQQDGDGLRFDASDVVRVRLICELHYELWIEEDSMSVVLSLLDQLYTTRRSLRALLSAVEAQPEDVRARIAALVKGKR